MTNKKEQTIQVHVKGNIYLSIHQSFSGRQETAVVRKVDGHTLLIVDTPKDLKDARDIVNDIMSIMVNDLSPWMSDDLERSVAWLGKDVE